MRRIVVAALAAAALLTLGRTQAAKASTPGLGLVRSASGTCYGVSLGPLTPDGPAYACT